MNLKVFVHGRSGRMGSEIEKTILATQSKFVLDSKLGPSTDLVLDFSSAEGSQVLFERIKALGHPLSSLLIGTTGLSDQNLKAWRGLSAAGTIKKILFAPNTSVGILLFSHALRSVSKTLLDLGFDPSIEETHHRCKIDRPSGTALFLAEALKQPSPPRKLEIFSTRGGGVFGEHRVRFLGDDEEFCLSHRAFSRTLFAKGALLFAHWLSKQSAGFYTLDEVKIADLEKIDAH